MDIVKQKVHIVDLNEGPSSHRVLADLDISIGTTADIEGNDQELAFGGKHGYGILDRRSGSYRYIRRYWDGDEDAQEKYHQMRGNDGGVDIRGRYWVGTMNDPLVTPFTDVGTMHSPSGVGVTADIVTGVVFRLDPDLSLHKMIEKITIPNGISWSNDGKTMYMADSPTKNVYAFDYDIDRGTISNQRVFFRVDETDGVPDGHAVDEEGYIWQALYGGGKVVRVSPEGVVVAEVLLPTRCPTCPCFAGEDIYITTAAEGEPEKYPESAGLAGSVFRCHVGVRGQRLHSFRYNAGAPRRSD